MTPTRTWTEHIAAWENYLRATGSPETTIGLRTYHLTRLARETSTGPATLTFDELVTWLAGHDWAPNTRRAYRGSLRAFYRWATATGRVTTSPAHLLPPVRVPRGKPRPAPEAAYRLALAIADERVRLAVLLAGQCGLRRAEIARTRTEHVEPDLLGSSLRVTGKGGHVRMVPLTDELAALITEHAPGWLFPSTHGGHLTPHHLGKLVTRCLPDDLTTHTLRHRCATVSYAGTRDLRAVQELLGHAKPETTAIYVAIPDESVRAAMLAAAA
ncbi:MAG: tyrosine-type recombinase/integrase [Mycobacteriales bacterium]